MSHIRLADVGHHLASRARASDLRNELIDAVDAGLETYVVDLSDVRSISDSFADEYFAVLAEERGDAWFRAHVRVEGASDVVRGSVIRAIRTRLERRDGTFQSKSSDAFELAPPPEVLEARP